MSAAPENEEQHYHCPVCLKGYKRREHLQRHRNSHKADRPYTCNTCGAAFKRTDTLRRHTETCEGRRALQSVASRKRRACDGCVRQKKSCNASSPCQNCQKRGVSCHYSYLGSVPSPSTASGDSSTSASNMSWRADGIANTLRPATSAISSVSDPSNHSHGMQFGDNWSALVHETVSDFNLLDNHGVDLLSQEWPDFMSPTEHAGQLATCRQTYALDRSGHGYSFHFLADFTSRTGLVSSFDCGTLSQRRAVVSSFHESHLGTADPMSTPAALFETGGSSTEARDSDDGGPPRFQDRSASTSGWQSWLDNPIVIKLQQIIIRIKEVVEIKPRNSTVTLSWSPLIERRCLDFFSVPRFGKFLELYWSVWHPNVNFVHRPTFNPMNTPTTLLAAMALTGK